MAKQLQWYLWGRTTATDVRREQDVFSCRYVRRSAPLKGHVVCESRPGASARGVFRRFWALSLGFSVLFLHSARGVPPVGECSSVAGRVGALPTGESPAAAVSDPAAAVKPLPAGALFERHVVVVGRGEVALAGESGELVYDNTLGSVLLGVSLAGSRISDDIATTAESGCPLDRYVMRVTGDRSGEGEDSNVPFSVTLALYPTCPGLSLSPFPIAGTLMTIDLPDGGLHEVEVVIPPDVEIPLPSSFFIGASFNRTNTGMLVGAPALKGISCDRMDYPGFPCDAGLGGYPNGPHASFYAQVYVRPGCAASFPAYRVCRQSGPAFTRGPFDPAYPGRNRFGDDIRLAVADCEMTAYEVSVKGKAATSSGVIEFDLKERLDNASPDAGGRIPGTRQLIFVFGSEVVVAHYDLDPPIPLPPSVFMTFATSTNAVGPVVAGRQPTVGSTEVTYRYFDSTEGVWMEGEFPGFYGALDITIYCGGSPSVGACCDTQFLDEQGEAVCRELPHMNCPANRWLDVATCDGDPFIPACGLGACCTPYDTCQNLTHNECLALAAPDEQILWEKNVYCGDVGFVCPYYACVQSEQNGDCARARSDVGCNDFYCCRAVCDLDPFCCKVAWDETCVRWWQETDECRHSVLNDSCVLTDEAGPVLLEIGEGAIVSNSGAYSSVGDPRFCCSNHWNEPGVGSLWYRFVATETSARFSTCDSNPSDLDSIIQVLRPLDPTTPETVCASLETIACNDDAPGCGDGRLSELCVSELVPGETYYLLLAGKTEEDRGIYHLEIDAPCTPVETFPPANNECTDATPVEVGVTPFDFADATFGCPGASCSGSAGVMGKDIWYRWESSVAGPVVIETCESDAATPATSLAVYEGCDCLALEGTEFACSDGPAQSCASGSSVSLTVRADTCYLIRVGAESISEPAGELIIRHICPTGLIFFRDPPPRLVDARQPHPPGDATLRQGIDRITALVPLGAAWPSCWSLCEPGQVDLPNAIAAVTDNGGGMITLTLSRPITPGGVTMIDYRDETGVVSRGRYIAHPGNVNGDRVTDEADLAALLDALNGGTTPRWDLYGMDIDHSGSLSPADVLRMIDLLEGGDTYAPGWRGTVRPTGDELCPN